MAATTAPNPAGIDFSAAKSYPVHLGDSIANKSQSSRYASVRYNHKPTLSASEEDVSCKLLPNSDSGSGVGVKLSLQTGREEWEYTGPPAREEKELYVLLFDGKGEVVLENVERSFGVNLLWAPGGEEVGGLPQLDGEGSGEGAFVGGGEEEEEGVEEGNPFDWRRVLRDAVERERESKMRAAREGERAVVVGRATPTAAMAAGKKRKAPAAAAEKGRVKTNPKRVRAGTSPPRSSSTTAATAAKTKEVNHTKAPIPEVRLDRKASTIAPPAASDQDDDDDDGELVLENDDSVSSKRGGSMGLALQGAFAGKAGPGPRSLRSAASMSPAGSRGGSPHVYEFEFGEDDNKEEDADGDGDEDEDGDVEDLALGSPVQEHRHRGSQGQVTQGGDATVEEAEEDDMEAQLALAMAQAEEEEAGVEVAVESEEDVSEEE